MNEFCPISFNRIDEHVARVNAIFTVGLSVLYIFTGWKIVPLLLLVDFFTRGFFEGKFSLLAIFSRSLVKTFGWKPKMLNAGPKIFAAQVGSILTGIAVVSHYFGVAYVGFYSIAVLGFFSFLESFFAICVACKIYPFIRKFSPDTFDPGL